MYLDGLDELDQKIIRLLIENARISYSDIGEETGISRVAVFPPSIPAFYPKSRLYFQNVSLRFRYATIICNYSK